MNSLWVLSFRRRPSYWRVDWTPFLRRVTYVSRSWSLEEHLPEQVSLLAFFEISDTHGRLSCARAIGSEEALIFQSACWERQASERAECAGSNLNKRTTTSHLSRGVTHEVRSDTGRRCLHTRNTGDGQLFCRRLATIWAESCRNEVYVSKGSYFCVRGTET